ncbi:MAG: GlsB/YeaQ/YmgE family stress response membrane protein [Thioalkalispiraceae bacterium]
MSLSQIAILLVVGLVAGWLAGLIMKGRGQGLLVNLIVGVVGAYLGNWLFGLLHISIGGGIASLIITALIGAIVLLALIKLIR